MVAKKIKPKRKTRTSPQYDDSLTIPAVGEMNEPPEHFIDYCYIIYGQKGIGKTTLCSQLSEKALVCMFEDRWNARIRMKAFPSATVEEMENGSPDPWARFKIIAEQSIESDEVDLLVVDSIDLAYQACLNHICLEDGIQHPGDVNDFGATWNAIKLEFRTVMESIRKSETTGLVFTSHCNEDRMEINSASKEQLKKLTVYSPSCSKAAQEYVRQSCDYGFFYGKHGRYRGLHFRWEDNIWTACGNDDHFLDADGVPIAILEIPSKTTAGKSVINAFNNQPTTLVLDYFQVDEPEDQKDEPEDSPPEKVTPKKKIPRRKV